MRCHDRRSAAGIVGGRRRRPAIRIERLELAEVTSRVLSLIQPLFTDAYHKSHMYERLLDDLQNGPDVFRLFLATSEDAVVGVRVIQSQRHPSFDYLGLPPIHGKRFSVSPDHRGRGIGKRLVEAGKSYVFDELGLPAIFGESREVGALAMHGREGALYLADSIFELLPRNTPQQSIAIYAECLVNPRLRELRFPFGEGVRFVYCRDEEMAAVFRERGYVSKEDILRRHAAGDRAAQARR